MRRAVKLARHADQAGEVPVGALLVRDDTLLAEAWNQPIASHDPTAHAEILVLRQTASGESNYRLPGTTLYVTLEPCLMCFGAMINARVARLVYGASDTRFGVVENIPSTIACNHHIEITGGVLKSECAAQLQTFFRQRRG